MSENSPQLPKPPSDLVARGRGRRFWKAVVEEHELRLDEQELLAEACRQLDLLDALRKAAGDTVMVGDRIHPALVEARQLRTELRRTLAALCLPDDPEEAGQQLPPQVASMRSVRARRAARARWSHGP